MSDTEAVSLLLASGMEGERRTRPSDFYEPHHTGFRGPRAGLPTGQLQFHRSTHPVRLAAPGNAFGGTVMMGHEINAWCLGTNRWQRTPAPPVQCIWLAPEFRQFAMILKELREKCFGPLPTLRESGFGGPQLAWPNGSVLYLASYDRSWEHVQGLNALDLAAFDEQPPQALWLEIEQRRRAGHKTRIICKATQTSGDSWMENAIYRPWLEYHHDRGIHEEEEMLARQLHPYWWLWSMGGIHDNPACDEQDIAEYEARAWRSPKERQVRLYGGFISWVGDPVFSDEDMAWLRQQAAELTRLHGPGVEGMLEVVGAG